MAERRRPERLMGSGPIVVGFVRDHRVNDLTYGHVGRVTYTSVEDAEDGLNINNNDSNHELEDAGNESSIVIGPLHTNRSAVSFYTFQEVARFQVWYPPTAHGASSTQTATPQYINRLLGGAPEIMSGVAGPLYPGFISVAKESERLKMPQTRLPLLSYGEITDMSSREPTGCLALAMATGQSGHALRIVQVRREHWGWHENGNLTLKLSNIDTEYEGHWCDNALSINQIKFTASRSDNGLSHIKQSTRWILVQTAAETIVFQPTLNAASIPISKNCACEYAGRGRNHLTANPIVRIPIKETGDRSHCDVAFNPAADAKPPQLAIIDEAGQWSVWNIIGSTHTRKNILLPFLHARGTFTDGIKGSLPSPAMHDLGHLYRVGWLPNVALLSGEPTQSSTMLLGSATAVNITSLDRTTLPLRVFNATHNVGLDNIVDVQVSPEVKPGCEPTYQQQIFQVARPDFVTPKAETEAQMLGQQAMLLLPKEVVMKQSSLRPTDTLGHQYIRSGVSVFQIISLGADMSLWSSLCASTSGPEHVRLAPFPLVLKRKQFQKIQKMAEKKRRAITEYFRNSFVVADDFEEHSLLPNPRTNSTKLSRQNSGTRAGIMRTFEVYNMARLYTLLQRHLHKAAKLAYEASDVVRQSKSPSPLDIIQQVFDIAAEHGSFAYTTLLNISNFEYLKVYGADLTDLAWTRELAKVDIGEIEDVRVSISSLMKEDEAINIGAETLYESMSKLCLIPRVGDGQRYSQVVVRRQGLLAFAAVQLYFSQISVAVMPRHVALGTAGDAAVTNVPTMSGVENGRLRAASTPYSGHSLGADTESRFRHNLSSSPAPAPSQQIPTRSGIPSWLPSSSQDDGLNGDGVLPSLEDGGDDTVLPESEVYEDPVVARLRQYAKSIQSEPLRNEGELRLLSHWPLGSDPAQFHWVPMGAAGEAEEELRRQAQEARERKRQKMEKRVIRDRERLLLLSGAVGGGVGTGTGGLGLTHLSSPVVPRIQLSSQVLPSQMPLGSSQQTANYYHAQQGGGMPSQQMATSPRPTGSQVFSSQIIMSQPMIRTGHTPGGQRPKKKKPKVARGFK
ncbi:hypothetical protein SEPCBS57363_002311 [Sporothrix epigloea]|uniref:Uncharacterized protein n=1 Tax=Sporothrix epigloea TaxID=1892477 RepID=A0ABP0DFC1_9PEZI